MKNFSTFYIRASLMNKLWKPTERKTKTTKKVGRPAPKFPDEVVLEVRRLREEQGWTPKLIADHMRALGWGLTTLNVDAIVDYRTRSHLVPEYGRKSPYITHERSL